MRTIAAIPATALIAGAAVGLASNPSSLAGSIALVGAALAAFVSWRWGRPRTFVLAIVAVFMAGGALLGADAWQRAWRPPLRVAFEQAAERGEWFTTLEGTLRADASSGAAGVSLSIDIDRMSGVLLTVGGSLAADRIDAWRAGRRVRVPATLRRPSRYLDPGVPDGERALARRGTTLVGTVKSGALVEVLARGSPIEEALASVRARARRAIADAVGRWDPQSAAIVAAIVIGDRAGLDPDVQRRLQDAGTYHVIAISGGNIAILAGLLIATFRVAGWLGRSAMLSSIALLLLYARLVGGGASVDRATMMAVVYCAGRAFDQRSPPLNALALVAGALVAIDPLSVADPAFILTFGATLAILVAVPTFGRGDGHETHESTKPSKEALYETGFVRLVPSCVSWLRRWSLAVALPVLAASIATEAFLFPVGALVFSRVTFAGLALNFLAIPLMAVAQVAGMLLVPLALVSRTGALGMGWVAYVGAAGLVWSANLVRLAPSIVYRLAPPGPVALVVYYTALALAWRLRRRSFALAAASAALWMLIDPHALVARRGDGLLHVTFIDVGQGDSAFVRFPHGSTLLVDAGGLSFASTFDIGDRVVAPVLRDAGFYRLDDLALTHGDPDHIAGARAIVREFRPREVWEGIPVPRSAPLTTLRLDAQRQGARWANVYAGDRVTIDGVDVIARHPAAADWERQKVRNDDSIVLELRWRDVSILLTGDIGKAVESALASSIPASRLRVMKVPHHGSLTSSTKEFVGAIRPQIAVVSVGRGNHFGHPSPDVLERYRSIGPEIFRTDEDGAVTVDTDGASLLVHAYLGRTFGVHETHENTKPTK